jgi:TatD DNase family protein
MLIDSHTHLSDDEYTSIESEVIDMLRALDIKAISVSMDINTARRNLSLAERYKDVIIPFVGLHPWCIEHEDVDEFTSFILSNIDKIKGIGEIGLDAAYASDYKKQKVVFERMLSIAERYKKPVSIHSRRAVDDVLAVLSSYNIKSVLLHWFSGSKKQLVKANDMGYYVSYGPVLVYSEEKRVLLRNSNIDLVLIETDGPVRYGSCFNNLMALPSFLVSVAYALSDTLNMHYSDAEEMLLKNSLRYLNC